MRIESLGYFLEVAQSGSLSLAARRLYISHQGLSKSIRQLEQELGVALFEREGNRLRLTAAGHDLIPLAQACLDDHDALLRGMGRHLAKGTAPKLKLLACPFVAISVFNRMKRILGAYELRNVALVETGFDDMLEATEAAFRREDAEGSLAIAIASKPMLDRIAAREHVAFTPVLRSVIGVLGPRPLLPTRKRAISAAEVARLPLACYSEPILNSIIEDAFGDHPLQNVVTRTTNLQLIGEYLDSGEAVTFWDSLSSFFDDERNELKFLPLHDPVEFWLGFMYPQDLDPTGPLLTYARKFGECVEKTCGAYLAEYPI